MSSNEDTRDMEMFRLMLTGMSYTEAEKFLDNQFRDELARDAAHDAEKE